MAKTNKDDFMKNLFMARADMRAAFGVPTPQALSLVALNAPPYRVLARVGSARLGAAVPRVAIGGRPWALLAPCPHRGRARRAEGALNLRCVAGRPRARVAL